MKKGDKKMFVITHWTPDACRQPMVIKTLDKAKELAIELAVKCIRDMYGDEICHIPDKDVIDWQNGKRNEYCSIDEDGTVISIGYGWDYADEIKIDEVEVY